MEERASEIDVGPLKRDHLASAQTSIAAEQHGDQRALVDLSGSFDQALVVLLVERHLRCARLTTRDKELLAHVSVARCLAGEQLRREWFLEKYIARAKPTAWDSIASAVT